MPALQRVGEQRLEALGGGLGRLGGIELEGGEAPGRLQGAGVEATGGQALAIAVALPGERVVDNPAAAARPQRVEGHEDGRKLAAAAQDDGHVPARSPVEPRRPARRSSARVNLEADARAARRTGAEAQRCRRSTRRARA